MVSQSLNNSTLPISRIIAFDSSLNGLLALFCCKSAWIARRWRWLSIFFTSLRTRKFSACFTTACGNPDTLKSMSSSSRCVNKPMDSSLSTGLPVLKWSAVYVFVCVFVLIWTFNRQIGILAVKWETCRFPEYSNGDVCSVSTSRPVLWIGFGFGWVGWELSACRATSESNSFIQLFLNEIFGGEVTHTLFRIWFLQFPSW